MLQVCVGDAIGNKPTLGKVQLKPSITEILGLRFLICLNFIRNYTLKNFKGFHLIWTYITYPG